MIRAVAFVGPLPPPVHGFSIVCAHVRERLGELSNVETFDRAPRGNSDLAKRVGQMVLPLRYLRWHLRSRRVSMYLALSGGYGQLYDWPFLLISKCFSSVIVVHHHSFAYLNSPSRLNRIVLRFLRKDTHIALSGGMRTSLMKVFQLDPAHVKVVSNAAFLPAAEADPGVATPDPAPICLGFLSNITFAKGFVDVFAVLSQLRARGISYSARIAGPIDAKASATFSDLLAGSVGTTYLGPIFGQAKDDFYRGLDCFLFPTDYANEAEPLVVHEAMRAGVHVIACDRGAIAEMLTNGAGRVFSKASFVPGAVDCIEEFSRNRAHLRQARRLSLEQFNRIQRSAVSALESLLRDMTGCGSVEHPASLTMTRKP